MLPIELRAIRRCDARQQGGRLGATFRIGTYNVENLFDRFDDPYETGDDATGRYRTSLKSRAKLYDLGYRIRQSKVDILGIQEVENYGALKDFVQSSVGPKFKVQSGITSQQSNDPRGIDLGVLSSLPLGRVISHRFNRFRTFAGKQYRFARDCLQVEILDADRSAVLLTVFVCHFKSKCSECDPVAEPDAYRLDQQKSADKRNAAAVEVVRIIQSQFSPDTERFAVLGDFNDTPDSPAITPLAGPGNALGLVSAAKFIDQSDGSAASRRPRDTHRWQRTDTETGKELRTWSQIDHILLSPAQYDLRTGNAKVMNIPAKQGSDHYLFWVEFSTPKNL